MALYQAISRLGRRIHIDDAISAGSDVKAAEIAKNNAVDACIDATETGLIDIKVDMIRYGFRVLTKYYTIKPNFKNGGDC